MGEINSKTVSKKLPGYVKRTSYIYALWEKEEMEDASKRAACSEIVHVLPKIVKAEACSPTSAILQTTLIDSRRKMDFFVLNLKKYVSTRSSADAKIPSTETVQRQLK